MASVFTHAFVALALGKACYPAKGQMPARFWVLAVACSAGPDLDTLLHGFGVEYHEPWGHRGMSHSLFFAAVVGLVVAGVFFARRPAPALSLRWWGLAGFFALLTASHGFFDAFTDGGYGIAFFAPFDHQRYFMPYRPIAVAPISAREFFGPWGVQVIWSELRWVWLPVAAMCGSIFAARRTWFGNRPSE